MEEIYDDERALKMPKAPPRIDDLTVNVRQRTSLALVHPSIPCFETMDTEDGLSALSCLCDVIRQELCYKKRNVYLQE